MNHIILKFRRHAPPLSYTAPNSHASGTRIGLMDGTVPIEALVSGVIHPRQGMPICSGCPRAGSNPPEGFMFNGLQGKNVAKLYSCNKYTMSSFLSAIKRILNK